MNPYDELAPYREAAEAALRRLSPEEIAAERAEEEAYLQREREDAARYTRERQSALALQLACDMIRETTGNPSDALDAARDFLAFLTGEPKTQITN